MHISHYPLYGRENKEEEAENNEKEEERRSHLHRLPFPRSCSPGGTPGHPRGGTPEYLP